MKPSFPNKVVFTTLVQRLKELLYWSSLGNFQFFAINNRVISGIKNCEIAGGKELIHFLKVSSKRIRYIELRLIIRICLWSKNVKKLIRVSMILH